MRRFTASLADIEAERQARELAQLRHYALMISEDAERRGKERKRAAANERRKAAHAAEVERATQATRRRLEAAAIREAEHAVSLARMQQQAKDQAEVRDRDILQRAVHGWQA